MTADHRAEAVQAVMEVMGCVREVDDNGRGYCPVHMFGWLRDVNACPRAERAAEAAIAAARPAIEREVADERDDLAQRLSHLLWDLTNGRLSKTNYDVRTMAQEIEATFDEAWQTEWEASEWEVKAEAWDEGFDAGHQAARAVNPEWPEQPTNPYRAALATGTTTNPQEADQ